MPTTSAGRLMLAAAVAYGASLGVAQAQRQSKLQEGCEQGVQEAMEHIDKKYLTGGKYERAAAVYSLLKAYLSAPDDKKKDAFVQAFLLESAGLLIRGFDVVRAGGMIAVGGVEYTIQQAEAAQLDAFLCGGGGMLAEGIFQTRGAQAIAPGITCENFADKITTIEQFNRLKRLYDDFYTRQVLEFGGRQNEDNYRKILYEEWQIVDRTWKAKTGARLYRNLLEDMIREAERMKAQGACKAPSGAGQSAAAPPAAAKGPHLALLHVDETEAMTVPEWKKAVDPGKITIEMPYIGRMECTWNEPPSRFDPDYVFNLDLTAKAFPKPGQRMSATLQLRSGFQASIPAGSGPEAYAEPGIPASKSMNVTVKAPDLTFMRPGDMVYLTIGGCDAGNVTYAYEFRR